MAINLNLSIMEHKKEASLDPAYTGALERGMVMVFATTAGADGQALVRPSAGIAAERVAGFLWLSETTQDTVPLIELFDIPALAPLTVSLRETPTAVGEIRAIRTDTGAAITVVAGAPGAGQLGLTAKVLTADAALAGLPIRVTYRFAISAEELARRGGRRTINQGGERPYAQVTLVYGNSRVMSSNFVTSDPIDPDTNFNIRTAAGGRFGTSGVGIIFGRCTQSPTLLLTPGIEQAFVGVEANLAAVP